jgi:hypothetical protein
LQATYFVEHNIALQNVDHFVELLKYRVPDSKIIADLEMKRTKCTGLITNVLAKVKVTEERLETSKAPLGVTYLASP